MQAPASMQYNYAQQVMANASLMNMQMQMAKQVSTCSFPSDISTPSLWIQLKINFPLTLQIFIKILHLGASKLHCLIRM